MVEASSESLAIKLKIFQDLDQLTMPETILTSNTYYFSISKIVSVTQKRDKVIGMHFMNPITVMKLVEVISGNPTSDEMINTFMNLAKTWALLFSYKMIF